MERAKEQENTRVTAEGSIKAVCINVLSLPGCFRGDIDIFCKYC